MARLTTTESRFRFRHRSRAPECKGRKGMHGSKDPTLRCAVPSARSKRAIQDGGLRRNLRRRTARTSATLLDNRPKVAFCTSPWTQRVSDFLPARSAEDCDQRRALAGGPLNQQVINEARGDQDAEQYLRASTTKKWIRSYIRSSQELRNLLKSLGKAASLFSGEG